MHRNISYEKSVQLLQTIMINNFYGWLRLPVTNLVDREDIIRFCCSRSRQASHILRALFALNQIDHSGDYNHIEQDIENLPRQPYFTRDKLRRLTCSGDFRSAAIAGLDLIKEILAMADAHYPELRTDLFLKAAMRNNAVMINIEQMNRLAQSIADAYTSIPGIKGIIVDGSLAKGIADSTSDIDLAAYCSVIPDIDARKFRARIIDEKSQVIPESDRFNIDGVYIHIDFELIDIVEESFAAFPHPPWWSPGVWEPIQTGRIQWDPELILQKWKNTISDISIETKKNLATELLRRLSDEEKRMYSAIQNDDPVHCSIVLGNMLTFYFQILGVINHRFMVFPKWMHFIINEFSRKPDRVYDRFCKILSADLYRDNLITLANEFQLLISNLVLISNKVLK